MFDDHDIAARHDQMLGRLAEIAMQVAEDSGRLVGEAETLEERQAHISDLDRMSRSVRLTIALQRRIRRERRADQAVAAEVRRKQLRAALIPQVRASTDHLGERFEREAELDEALAEEALYEAFLNDPPHTAIARLAERLDIPFDTIRFPLDGGRARDGSGAFTATLRPADYPTTKTTKTIKAPLPLARAGPS